MIPRLVNCQSPISLMVYSTMVEPSSVMSIDGLPSHLQCHETATAGRTVTTLKDIPKGSIVLLATPFAHTIHHRYRSKTCEHCFRFLSIDSEESLSHPCLSNCGKHYCSLSCRRIGRARHNSTSCGLSIQVNALKNNNRLMHEALSFAHQYKLQFDTTH